MGIPQPIILHLSQDDPKKCSARKMARMKKAKLVSKMEKLPFKAILLDPFSEKALSPDDRRILMKRGIVAVDCSWEDAENVFPELRTTMKMESRALPGLLAANPTKFGKWGELSTLEALSASYYIMGEKEIARDMLKVYTWGIRFLETNIEPLEAYSRCKDSTEVVAVQKEFI
jgi:pre-rRNA-processing protein TSR3